MCFLGIGGCWRTCRFFFLFFMVYIIGNLILEVNKYKGYLFPVLDDK